MQPRRVCVFAGSSEGAHPDYRDAAVLLGAQLAERSITLVYGGASIGLMGLVADAVLDAGGQVIGVIPRSLRRREVAHEGLTELRVVGSMHERIAVMGELSDAFVALPGGLGTLAELFEVATWTQLGLHAKPCGLVNVRGYYDRLAGALDHAAAESFLGEEHRGIVISERDSNALLERIVRWSAPPGKWQAAAQPNAPDNQH